VPGGVRSTVCPRPPVLAASTPFTWSNVCGALLRFAIEAWPRTLRGFSRPLHWRTCTCSDDGCCRCSEYVPRESGTQGEAREGRHKELAEPVTQRFPMIGVDTVRLVRQTPVPSLEIGVGCDQMFTAHRCETAPVVDSPRHLRKTHGPEPDAARLPSVQ
jgi:hypothetical protein